MLLEVQELHCDFKKLCWQIGIGEIAIVKVFLATVIIAAVTYIFIALAYGGCPTLTDLTNPKFQETALGVGIILLPQIGFLITYKIIKK